MIKKTINDEFSGSTENLRKNIKALIELGDADALFPNKLEGHARVFLASAYHRLTPDDRRHAEAEPLENPPAFPVNTSGPEGHQTGSHPSTWQFPGMTMRDYFAAKAMQTFIAGEILRYTESACDEHCAHYAYKFADAMLAARKEGA